MKIPSKPLFLSSAFLGALVLLTAPATSLEFALEYDGYSNIDGFSSRGECTSFYGGGMTGTCVLAVYECGFYEYEIFVEQDDLDRLKELVRDGNTITVNSMDDYGYFSEFECQF